MKTMVEAGQGDSISTRRNIMNGLTRRLIAQWSLVVRNDFNDTEPAIVSNCATHPQKRIKIGGVILSKYDWALKNG